MSKLLNLRNILFGNQEKFEFLGGIKNVPAFNGAVEMDQSEDKFYNLEFCIGCETGVLQLYNSPPLSDIYQEQTTTQPIGGVWISHHNELCRLLEKYRKESWNVLEIGGAHGYLASLCLDMNLVNTWKIVEPNPCVIDSRINVRDSYFDANIDLTPDINCIVHSHVFEHFTDPYNTCKNLSNHLKDGEMMFCSIPNLWQWVKRGQPNGLNFEHTYLLTQTHFEELVVSLGLEIVELLDFANGHSLIYVLRKNSLKIRKLLISNLYDKVKPLYADYIDSFNKVVESIEHEISKVDKTNQIYLFGSHLFSQFLLVSGLSERIKITAVLDNNPSKNNKRLYGSSLITYLPEIIRGVENPIIIVKAGSYTEEISKQLLAINNHSIIIS